MRGELAKRATGDARSAAPGTSQLTPEKALEDLAKEQARFSEKVLAPAQSLVKGAETNLATSQKNLEEGGFAASVTGLTATNREAVATDQKDLANKAAHAEKLKAAFEASQETKRAAEEMLATAKRIETQGFANEAAEMRKGASELLHRASESLKGLKSIDKEQVAETMAGLQKLNEKLDGVVHRAGVAVSAASITKETAHVAGVGVGFAMGGPAGGAAVNQGLRMLEGVAEEGMQVALGNKSSKEAGSDFLKRSADAVVESGITLVAGAAGQKIGAIAQKFNGPVVGKVVDSIGSGAVQSAGTGIQIGYEFAKAHNEFEKQHGKLSGAERDRLYAEFMTDRGLSLEEVSKRLGVSFLAGAGAKVVSHGVEKVPMMRGAPAASHGVVNGAENATNTLVEVAANGQPITLEAVVPALLGGHVTHAPGKHAPTATQPAGVVSVRDEPPSRHAPVEAGVGSQRKSDVGGVPPKPNTGASPRDTAEAQHREIGDKLSRTASKSPHPSTANPHNKTELEGALHKRLADLHKEFLSDPPGFDCGDCADSLRALCPREVLESDSTNRIKITASEKGGKGHLYLPQAGGEKVPYVYHFAFIHNGHVYDPFMSPDPIPHNDYVHMVANHQRQNAPEAKLKIESVRRNMGTDEFLNHQKWSDARNRN
jgi:hypothetical protein